MKYKKHYDLLIKKYGTKTKPKEVYTERHHIIPRCLGGSNHPDNLVYLEGRVHFIAHRFLNKMYPDNSKLLTAVVMMSKFGGARSYSELKQQYAELRKQEGKREGRPVVTPKGTFPSIWAAAKAHNLSRARMKDKLLSTAFTCRFYYFLDTPKKSKERTGHGLHLAKKVETPLGVFNSCREAAQAHGIQHSVVARRAKNPNRSDFRFI